jgi:hypothetical protein
VWQQAGVTQDMSTLTAEASSFYDTEPWRHGQPGERRLCRCHEYRRGITGPAAAVAGLSVSFRAVSFSASASSPVPKYRWTFGDGRGTNVSGAAVSSPRPLT